MSFFFSAGYDEAIIEYWHYGSSNIREALHTLYRDRVFNILLAFITVILAAGLYFTFRSIRSLTHKIDAIQKNSSRTLYAIKYLNLKVNKKVAEIEESLEWLIWIKDHFHIDGIIEELIEKLEQKVEEYDEDEDYDENMQTKSNSESMTTLSRYKGSLLGLAVGDALGTTLEFKEPGTFSPITGMMGGGPFNLEAGEWTDDTSMALCLADSLIEKEKFDPKDQMQRYLKFFHEGYLSSNGTCFDIGNTIHTALKKFQLTKEPYCGSKDPNTAGNGSLMRLAPIPLAYANNEKVAIEKAAESSRTTHGTENCVDACRYMTILMLAALKGETKEAVLNEIALTKLEIWDQKPLAPKITAIASGSYQKKNPPDIKGTGYVVESLEAALWAFYNSKSFEEGALMAVNLGNDADTTGAIYGQLAGAYYGEKGIPDKWKRVIAYKDYITKFAEELYELKDRIEI